MFPRQDVCWAQLWYMRIMRIVCKKVCVEDNIVYSTGVMDRRARPGRCCYLQHYTWVQLTGLGFKKSLSGRHIESEPCGMMHLVLLHIGRSTLPFTSKSTLSQVLLRCPARIS